MMKMRRERSSSFSSPNLIQIRKGDGVENLCREEDEGSAQKLRIDGVDDQTQIMRRRLSCDLRLSSSTGNMREWTIDDLEDLSINSWHKYHLRCFNVSSKGLVLRKGDIVRYRRIRSLSFVTQPKLSLATTSEEAAYSNTLAVPPEAWDNVSEASSSRRTSCTSETEIEEFIVYVVGSSNVGKSALIQQFTTADNITNFTSDMDENPKVTVLMDGHETRLLFRNLHDIKSISMDEECGGPCAFMIVYAVTHAESFLAASYSLTQLMQQVNWPQMTIILVGNKSDLVRSRCIDFEEGQMLANSFKVKFIETSVGINYNVDELLVGVLRNLRSSQHKRIRRRSKCVEKLHRARTSIKKMFGWINKPETSFSSDIFKLT